MANRQLEHHEIINPERKFPVIVICENIESPENIGMAFRICEAMGVESMIFTGSTITPPNRKISKISRSTEKHIPYKYYSNTNDAVEYLKRLGYTILALEITENSEDISTVRFSNNQKYALIIGSEKHGVDAETLNSIDLSLAITLFGKNTSINVVSALSIGLYELTKQLNQNMS